mmetsp:Transcript_2139/g.8278  ORF Transcript_2139/g.8278 Transcript_2139/m.8278 type:complete len:213 (-) Transcript_2139:574-1212(-)
MCGSITTGGHGAFGERGMRRLETAPAARVCIVQGQDEVRPSTTGRRSPSTGEDGPRSPDVTAEEYHEEESTDQQHRTTQESTSVGGGEGGVGVSEMAPALDGGVGDGCAVGARLEEHREEGGVVVSAQSDGVRARAACKVDAGASSRVDEALDRGAVVVGRGAHDEHAILVGRLGRLEPVRTTEDDVRLRRETSKRRATTAPLSQGLRREWK